MAALSKFEKGLNAAQRDAVVHVKGPLLVLAGAGSGKTRVVTRRIALLIARGHAKPSEILGLTFTNKAAGEMRERVAALIGKRKAGEVVLSTFHSFCLTVLREHIERIGYRKNFTVSNEGDTRTLIRRALDDLDGIHESFSPGVFRERIGLMKGAGIGLEDDETSKNDKDDKYRAWLPEIYERYESALRASNALDFDDLLSKVLELWKQHPRVLSEYRKRFKYVLVDEYQDTNTVQYRIVRSLVEKHQNLCVVGDDDQAIYAWRGADVRNILDFEKDYPKAKIVTLDTNYRSTGTILSAANALVANNRDRRDKSMSAHGDDGVPIDWYVMGDEEHEAAIVLQTIENMQRETGADCSDFAVLYRSNIQSRPFEIAFRQAGIPYNVIGGQEFFDRAEVRDIIAYLKVLVNPWDEASFLRVVNMPRRGIGDKTLHAIHDLCREQRLSLGKGMARALQTGAVAKQAEQGIRTFLAVMQEFRKRLRAREQPLSEAVRELVQHIGYKSEIERRAKTPEHASMQWDNVQAVVRAIEDYEASTRTPTLSGFLDESTLNTDSDRDSNNNDGRDAVTLLTMHSAKGLEFTNVFVVGCEEGLVPHERSLRENTLEEERRLFYVALTRAKQRLFLCEAISRSRYGKERLCTTSRFLKEIPEALLTKQPFAARDMVEARIDLPKPKPRSRKRSKKVAAMRRKT